MSRHDEHPDVRLIRDDGTAVLELLAHDRRNALTGSMASALTAALRTADEDPALGALVLFGGPAFCAGAHRAVLAGVREGRPGARAELQAIYDTFDALRRIGIPTVAAIAGPAVGAGLNLALACDVRLVAPDARLHSMFLANGIHPAGGHLSMLDRIGGRQAAVALACLDEGLDAEDATRLGLALRVETDVRAAAVRLVARAAANPPLARLVASTANALPTTATLDRLEADHQYATLTSHG